ncbi:hypothetical protein F4780DRAFT_783409 [Xylariomycetidae sp. FL0641]|nr:hypothetical protein F4780DRAFT_783409 [Xylariomycetidae sp. FL0641]
MKCAVVDKVAVGILCYWIALSTYAVKGWFPASKKDDEKAAALKVTPKNATKKGAAEKSVPAVVDKLTTLADSDPFNSWFRATTAMHSCVLPRAATTMFEILDGDSTKKVEPGLDVPVEDEAALEYAMDEWMWDVFRRHVE